MKIQRSQWWRHRARLALSVAGFTFGCADDADGDRSGVMTDTGNDTADVGTGGAGDPAATDGETSGDEGTTGPGTETGPTTTADETGSETGGLEGCLPELACPKTPGELGVPGELAVDSVDVTWTFSAQCEAALGLPVSLGEPIYVNVPKDIVGLGVIIDAQDAAAGFARVIDARGDLIDLSADGPTGLGLPPLKHLPTSAGGFVMPMSNETHPTPGCLGLVPVVEGDREGEMSEVHFVSRRYDGVGELRLNLIVVDGVTISQPELDEAVTAMNNLYQQNNAAFVADAQRIDVTSADGPYIPAEGPELAALRATMAGEDESRMNVFFIGDFTTEAGILGMASGIPGPNGVHMTAGSGVVVSLDSHLRIDGTLDVPLLSETMAHEVGHQLGLFHTTEADGSDHDLADDTPECTQDMDTNRDGFLTAEECADGGNIMFWTASESPQQELSPEQSGVIFFSPTIR